MEKSKKKGWGGNAGLKSRKKHDDPPLQLSVVCEIETKGKRKKEGAETFEM